MSLFYYQGKSGNAANNELPKNVTPKNNIPNASTVNKNLCLLKNTILTSFIFIIKLIFSLV
ncbi:membrane protein [Clostridium acetobutylicum]|nr:membrane protein [Clostridium acetobutylicum]